MSYHRLLLAGVITFVTLAQSANASVDYFPYSRSWPVGKSYKKVIPGGKYVFVMIRPISAEDETRGEDEASSQEIRALRRTYTQSGLYRDDGSTTPLWTIDWSEASVDVASDGVHLVRHAGWPLWDADREAVSFFANGKLIRSYKIKDLVGHPKSLERSAFEIYWCRDQKFDDSKLTYTIDTAEVKRFVFDVTTGEIISRWHPVQTVSAVILAVSGVLLLLLVASFWRKWRKRNQEHFRQFVSARPFPGGELHGSTRST